MIDNWEVTTADSLDGRSWHTLEYNLTRAIVNRFKNTDEFTNNWANLAGADNVIDKYIKDTIVNYYNISKAKIEVNQYTKPYDGKRLAIKLDPEFVQNNAKNVEGSLVFLNNEYIYKVQVPVLPDLSYFFSFVLTEK
ncbi:MAG: hypothetical protein HC831_22595 [Chloroflexia bacterium]|nr:hypothetical protein [Chloroflexia bacterium]